MRILFYLFSCLSWIAIVTSCQPKTNSNIKDEHLLLNEDSLELMIAYSLQDKVKASVYPAFETDPISASSLDDAADDPAIWFNKKQPNKSLIFGSNKMGGISVTNLQGKEIAYYKTGKINNIDVIYDFPFRDTTLTLLGCSNRTSQSINLYAISENGELRQLNHPSYNSDPNKIDDIYGFCFGADVNSKKYYVFINGKNGLVQQFEMNWKGSDLILALKREIQFDSQTEGMVSHKASGKIYIGEEDQGVWATSIDPKTETKDLLPQSGESNQNIKYDIEGITIYSFEDSDYLIASSQGNFSYAVFDIGNNNHYLGSFKIKGKGQIDGVEETDGIDVFSDSISVDFPQGMLVVQDGFNYTKDSMVAQNFKYIDTRQLQQTIAKFNSN